MVYGCSMVLGLGWFTVVYHIRGVHGTRPFERMNSTWLRWLDRIAHLVVG
jgi:hypothetical protein